MGHSCTAGAVPPWGPPRPQRSARLPGLVLAPRHLFGVPPGPLGRVHGAPLEAGVRVGLGSVDGAVERAALRCTAGRLEAGRGGVWTGSSGGACDAGRQRGNLHAPDIIPQARPTACRALSDTRAATHVCRVLIRDVVQPAVPLGRHSRRVLHGRVVAGWWAGRHPQSPLPGGTGSQRSGSSRTAGRAPRCRQHRTCVRQWSDLA